MKAKVDNTGENDYHAKLGEIALRLRSWEGPIVVLAHVEPDGDALGSCLTLKRALEALGKKVVLPMEPPRFLRFLAEPGELSGALGELPQGCLLAVLDVADRARAWGAPSEGAEFVVNIDHHGTNDRFGDLSLVEPAKAATAVIVKELVDALGVPWSAELATPCLTGILTDTGNFRHANTTPDTLHHASELIAAGVQYATLVDRLQWRHPDYFRMMGMVMGTVEFHLDGLAVSARITAEMSRRLGETEDDSDDYVGHIRYAEGTKVAFLLKEREDGVKVSVRTRDGVSAQAICLELGGGGHVPAAGAKLAVGLEEAQRRVLEATRRELERHGLLTVARA